MSYFYLILVKIRSNKYFFVFLIQSWSGTCILTYINHFWFGSFMTIFPDVIESRLLMLIVQSNFIYGDDFHSLKVIN